MQSVSLDAVSQLPDRVPQVGQNDNPLPLLPVRDKPPAGRLSLLIGERASDTRPARSLHQFTLEVACMAKRKAAKKQQTVVDSAADAVEPMVIAMAEQLGTFLGRVQKQADGWLDNPALRQQVSQIREGATQLLERVNRAGTEAAKSATKMMPGKKAAKKAKRSAAKSPAKSKGRSGGVVDAPGKRHRKPPPEELFDKRLGEPMGLQMGQKSLKRRPRGRS